MELGSFIFCFCDSSGPEQHT